MFDLFAHERVKEKHIDFLTEFIKLYKSIPTDYCVRENEFKVYIDKEVQKLPPKMRRIFELSRKDNLSHQEIAEKLDTTKNNVSTQMMPALIKLKTKLGIILHIFIF